MDALNYLIVGLGALLVLQAAWIAVLIIKDRRHAATDREHYAEVTHAARLSVIGEMTAAIVHEVTQPLSAILSNVETAELLLQAPDPKLASVLWRVSTKAISLPSSCAPGHIVTTQNRS